MTVWATMAVLLIDNGLTPAQANLTMDHLVGMYPDMEWDREATDFAGVVDDHRENDRHRKLAVLPPREN